MLDAIYDKNKHKIESIKKSIKYQDTCSFKNMPRNVIRPDEGLELRLVERHPQDISVPLIRDVAQRHPELTFWVEAPHNYVSSPSGDPYENDGRHFREAYVLNGDEPLGRITALTEQRGIGGVSFINNRIDEKLTRGNSMKTTKLTKAKSIFNKYFHGLTTIENMQVLAAKVGYTLSTTKYDLQDKVNATNTQLTKFVQNEIQKKNSTLLRFVKDMGQGELIEKHNKATGDFSILQRINSAVKDNDGYYVMFEGNDYFTWRKQDTTTKRHKREDMPEDMRMAVGLLKISPVETFVDGAGYKLKDNQFFIRDEVQLELN